MSWKDQLNHEWDREDGLLRGDGVRGHAQYIDDQGRSRHADDDSVCAGSERCTRPCISCGEQPVEGHDACLASLPGVDFACCGHGDPRTAYIKFENGVIVRHFDVIERSCQIGKRYDGNGTNA